MNTTKEKIQEVVQNKIFKVKFIKLDGSVRYMCCRFGVHKHLKHNKKVVHPENYLTVFDMHKKGYRNVNINTIQEIKCGAYFNKIRHGE